MYLKANSHSKPTERVCRGPESISEHGARAAADSRVRNAGNRWRGSWVDCCYGFSAPLRESEPWSFAYAALPHTREGEASYLAG